MKTIRRIILIGLFLTIALTGIGGKALCEDVVYWVNPNGGRYYHLDQNCPSVNPKYLPLPVSMTKEELEQPTGSFYLPCNICVDENYTVPVPEELRETGTPTEEPVWEKIIDPQYAEYALTDRYVEEKPVLIDEHNMLAKAERDPEGYARANRYLQWYRDGKLNREVECKYRDPSRWLYEGVFLSLPDGNVGLAAIAAKDLSFYHWDEDGLTAVKSIPGNWYEIYGNTKGICAISRDENSVSAHVFDASGNEVWTYVFDDPGRIAGWYANPDATDGEGTYLVIVRVESGLYTAFCVREGETVWQQNLLYGGNAFYAGDETFILAETTSEDDLYADLILDHRDMEGRSLGTKRLSGDRVVKSVQAILYNDKTGGYTIYGRAVANSRGVYTVFRMELDDQMNQQSISVREFDFHRDYNYSVLAASDNEAYVYCRTYDESYVQPVLVPFVALQETEPHGLRLH